MLLLQLRINRLLPIPIASSAIELGKALMQPPAVYVALRDSITNICG